MVVITMLSQNTFCLGTCCQGALSVLFEMEQEAVLPDLVLYNTIMGCCGKSNRWRWSTVNTLDRSGHVQRCAKMCKDVQGMHSWNVVRVLTTIDGMERESVISSLQRTLHPLRSTLQADCSFVTADWQLCIAAKHGSLFAMCLWKSSGGQRKTCQQHSRKKVETNTKKIYFVVW